MESTKIKNGLKISTKEIPDLNINEFISFLKKSVDESKRCILLFGKKEGESVRVYAVMSDDNNSLMYIVSTLFEKQRMKYESLTNYHPSFNLFERELFEEWGIVPEGHPFLKPVRYPHCKFDNKAKTYDYPFYTISSDEIHQVAVGPVHAGVIEPGHFRFLCEGEKIIHLEIQLGYQHRGVENLFLKGNITDKMELAESITGDTVIGNAYAYSSIIEGTLDIKPTEDELLERAIALEMERIAVHIGDIGAIANDVAYMIGSAVSGANRTYVINTMLAICGSRFGRGFIGIGKNNYRITEKKRNLIKKNLHIVRENMEQLCEEMFDSPSVLSRLENTGAVTAKQARECGFVGMAARASGVKIDSRSDHPFGAYRKYPIHPLSLDTGDVFARAYLRYLEMQQSMNYINELLMVLGDSPSVSVPEKMEIPSNTFLISLIEGWRGEVVHAVVTDEKNRARYKIKDPSFNNWFALALSVRGNGISDFPLCNKSFNLSYCGNDL
ncbi:MAG: NADH-quinone oxidoreductase subunit C [bacterium]